MMLLKLFLFFLFLLGLPDWYIYKKYVKRSSYRWARVLHWLPSISLLLGMVFIFSLYEPKPSSLSVLSLFLITFLCITVPKAIFCIFVLLLKPFRFKESVAGALAIASLAYLLFGATKGTQHFQVREVTYTSADLPKAFDGYRLIHLSDMHVGSWAGNPKPLQKAVKLINEQQADVVLFTGDLVNNLATELDEFMPILSQIKAKDGVYSVLGNHDYSLYIQWKNKDDQAANLQALKDKEAQMGWRLLNNENAILYRGSDSIAIVGVENCGRPPFPHYGNLPEAMKGTEGMFKVLMSHDPTHWRREVLPDTDIQLTLAGHTHAMQTSFFGFSPSRFVYPEHDGMYSEGNQSLYVNVGLGFLMFPMRLGAWPEITVITLKSTII